MSTKTDTLAPFFFHEGKNDKVYKYMGCHAEVRQNHIGESLATFVFRVWAPRAEAVFLVGDFNAWGNDCPMHRISGGGVWEVFVDADRFAREKAYKYKICTPRGEVYRSDPYGMYKLDGDVSLVWDVPQYAWKDAGWMRFRQKNGLQADWPINIYEVHLGSWKRDKEGNFLSYEELASELACYVKQMGYTHVELLPVMEHTDDGAVCAYYSPTSRHGTPAEFMQFVDIMHEAGIGVILDWNPSCISKAAKDLLEFDGNPLYECRSSVIGEYCEGGTFRFDVGRDEVSCFLLSNVSYWADCYHVDGFRVCGVEKLTFFDDGRRNVESVAFFEKFRTLMREKYSDVLVIVDADFPTSQNSSDLPLRWETSVVDGILSYAALEPQCKKYSGAVLPLQDCSDKRNILAVSHFEVSQGKGSFLNKMPGEYEQKFAGVRAALAYLMTRSEKKLMFMGNEIGQLCEWEPHGQVEWHLLDFDAHAKLQLFFARMNHFYLEHPALWNSGSPMRDIFFDKNRGILSYTRAKDDREELVVVINFTADTYRDLEIVVPRQGEYLEVLNSDLAKYGGNGLENASPLSSSFDGKHFIRITVPPLAACIFLKTKE